MKILAIPALLACLAAGANLSIKELADRARSAPPEFAADALIRIAAQSQDTEKATRIAWLEEAFRIAGGAAEPYRKRAALRDPEGAAGYFERIYAQESDALSLQLRAVDALLPLDAAKARELFQQIAPPAPPRIACEEYLVPDVSRFYSTLARMAEGHDAPRLLERYTAAITSPVQVGPAARMLGAAPLSDKDFDALVTAFAGAIRLLSGDDRSFTASAGAGDNVQALAEAWRGRGRSPALLLEAYRTYLVNHLGAARCAGSDSQDVVKFFNNRMAEPPLRPIEEREATPSKMEGKPEGLRACDNQECRSVRDKYRALIFNEGNAAFTPDQKTRPEWKARLAEFLSALDAWQEGASYGPGAFFREKSAFYSEILGIVADTDGRRMAARAAVQFYANTRLRAANPMEWLLPVNALIARAGLSPRDLEWLGDDLAGANDPIIALYMELERAAPRGPEALVPLL